MSLKEVPADGLKSFSPQFQLLGEQGRRRESCAPAPVFER